MSGNKPTENQFDLQVNAEVTKTGLPQLYQDLIKLQTTTRELNAALQQTFSKHTKGDDALGFAAVAKDISNMVFELKQAQKVMRELGALKGATPAGLRGERTLGEAAEVNRLTKAQKEAFKLQVASGEIKAADIRRLKDEAKLKLVISALDDKRWREGRLGNRDNGRLLLAQKELQALKNYRAFERTAEAERLRTAREYETAWDQALRANAAFDKKRDKSDADRRANERAEAARQRQADREALRKEDLANARTVADYHAKAGAADAAARQKERQRQGQIARGELLPDARTLTGKKLGVRRTTASQVEIDQALKSTFSKRDIFQTNDIPTLQVQARYAKIRTSLQALSEEQRVAAAAFQKDIQDRIAALKRLDRELAKPSPTAQQQFQKDLATGKYKTSQLSAADVSGATAGLKRTGDLSRFEQGQRARLTVAEARGDAGTAADAKAALAHLAKQKEAILKAQREVNEQARKQQKEASLSEADRAAKRLQENKKQLAADNETTLAAGQRHEMEGRIAKVKENQRIAALAANKLDLEGAKQLQTIHGVSDQMAASRYRAARAASQQELESERQLQDMLRSRRRELDTLQRRVAENPEDRQRRLEESRRSSRERLFGDGGANIMLIQAGLMANYQILGGLQNLFSGAVSAAVEFDAALHQLQAISAATRNEMVELKSSLIEVAQGSKFSAAEVAQASVLLAQAGLSVSEIQNTMSAVIALATASGSELKKSVDVMTSVLTVFDMGAEQSETVANKLTAALNRSKLDIDKMALGLQYAGNAAADAGVSFDELVSGLSAMANAGIRSGSTLGTGLRQLFVDIQKPSGNFQTILDRLGISLSDVDIRAQGFEGVLRNLIDKGFTTADAFKAFQIRSASAFAALSNNIDTFHEMQNAIQGTNAALEANAIQMESMAVQYDHLKSNLGLLAAEGFKPLLLVVRDTTTGLAHALETVDKGGTMLKVTLTLLGAGLAALATTAGVNAVMGIGKLVGGMTGLFTITKVATAATANMAFASAALAAGAEASAVKVGLLGLALKGLQFLPILVGVGLVAAAFGAFSSETDKLKNKLDEAKTKFNEFSEANNKSRQQLENVDKAVETLSERYGRLSKHSDELETYVRSLAEQFKDQGVTLSDLSNKSIPELISRLNELRDTLSSEYVLRIQEEGTALENVNKLEIQKQYTEARALARKLPASYAAPLENHNRAAKLAGLPETAPNPSLEGAHAAILAARGLVSNQNRGLMPKEGIGAYNNVGTLRKDLVSYQQDPALRKNKALSAQIESALRIMDLLDSLHNKQIAGKRIKSDTDARARAERLITERRTGNPDGTSGFDVATTALSALSVNNEKPGGNKDMGFLQRGAQALKSKIAEVKATLAAIPDSDAGDRVARNKELQTLAEALSRYEIQLAPLQEQADKDRIAELTAQIESIKKEEAALKSRRDGELSPKVRGKHTDELATLRARRVGQESELRTLQERNSKVSARVQEINRQRLAEDTRLELAELSAAANKGDAEARAKLRKLLQDSGALIDEAFQRQYQVGFNNLEKSLERELKDQKARGRGAQTKLGSELDQLELQGRGFSTDTRLFNRGSEYPQEMGTLGFRAQAAARLQAAAARRRMAKAEQTANFERANLLGGALPGLQQQVGDQQQMVLALERAKNTALEAQRKSLAETQRREAAGEAMEPAYQEAVNALNADAKAAVEAFEQGQEALDKMQEKVEAYQRERQALLLGYAEENSRYSTMFSALRVGVEGLTSGLSDALQRIVTKTGDVSDAFEEMGRNILASMLQVITNKISQQFVDMLLSTGASMFSPGVPTAAPSGKLGDFVTAPGVGQVARNGGMIRRAGGGFIPGTTVGRDSTHLLAQPGEYVLQKSAAGALGESFLDNLNRTTSASLRQGGERAKAAKPQSPTEPGLVNVWVVSPDQQTGMSKDDIVVTVSDNISRGGSIRKLIKQVQMGG